MRTTLATTPIAGGVRLTWRVHEAADVASWLAFGLFAAGLGPLLAMVTVPTTPAELVVVYAMCAAPFVALASWRRLQRVEIDVTTASVVVRERPFASLRPPRVARTYGDRDVRVLLEGREAIEVPIRVADREEAEHVVAQIRDVIAQVNEGRGGYRR